MQDKMMDELDQIADKIHEKFLELIDRGEFEEITKSLEQAASIQPDICLSMGVTLDVYDSERDKSLIILDTRQTFLNGKSPYIATGDSTLQRYVVNGDIIKVPHNYCPHCWEEWDFKLRNPTCSYCNYTLGNEVKLLLDTDVCPHCEKGKISMNHPKCDQCGFVVSTDIVVWG